MRLIVLGTVLVSASLAGCKKEPPPPPPPPPTPLELLTTAPRLTVPEVTGGAALVPAVPRVRVVVRPNGVDVDTEALWASWPQAAREAFQAAQEEPRRSDLPLVRRAVVKLEPVDAGAMPNLEASPSLTSAVSEALEVERRFRAHAKLPDARSSVAVLVDTRVPYASVVRVLLSVGQASDALDVAFLARRAGAPVFVTLQLPGQDDDDTPRVLSVLSSLGKDDSALGDVLTGAFADAVKPKPRPPPKPAPIAVKWPSELRAPKPHHDAPLDPSEPPREPLITLGVDDSGCSLLLNGGLEKVPSCAAPQVRALFGKLKPLLGERPARATNGVCSAPKDGGCRSGTMVVVASPTLPAQALLDVMALSLEDPSLFTRVMLGVL